MNIITAIFIGGGLGSLARYGVSLLALRFASRFPLGTLLSNLLACFLLAMFVVLLKERFQEQVVWRYLLITGFCGGFSTFSTFSFENYTLFKTDHLWLGLLNILISVIFGVLIMYLLMKDFNLHDT